MYTCKVCGKEFDDWHAVGGHMRKHTSKMKKEERREDDVEDRNMMLGKALGRLSELSAQEAWQIVVNWIMDVYRQKQMHDEILQSYRIRVEESESKIESVQRELKRMQSMVEGM